MSWLWCSLVTGFSCEFSIPWALISLFQVLYIISSKSRLLLETATHFLFHYLPAVFVLIHPSCLLNYFRTNVNIAAETRQNHYSIQIIEFRIEIRKFALLRLDKFLENRIQPCIIHQYRDCGSWSGGQRVPHTNIHSNPGSLSSLRLADSSSSLHSVTSSRYQENNDKMPSRRGRLLEEIMSLYYEQIQGLSSVIVGRNLHTAVGGIFKRDK